MRVATQFDFHKKRTEGEFDTVARGECSTLVVLISDGSVAHETEIDARSLLKPRHSEIRHDRAISREAITSTRDSVSANRRRIDSPLHVSVDALSMADILRSPCRQEEPRGMGTDYRALVPDAGVLGDRLIGKSCT